MRGRIRVFNLFRLSLIRARLRFSIRGLRVCKEATVCQSSDTADGERERDRPGRAGPRCPELNYTLPFSTRWLLFFCVCSAVWRAGRARSCSTGDEEAFSVCVCLCVWVGVWEKICFPSKDAGRERSSRLSPVLQSEWVSVERGVGVGGLI